MCGIIFILSKNKTNIIKYLLNSLNLIQNRGYDSMGICYYNDEKDNYIIKKHANIINNDCFDLLKNTINSENIISHIGFGHTRWATHGGITYDNSHPHISYHKKIILVHNGIINNYKLLKNKLLENNFNFYSETDSEIIANLIEYYVLYMGNKIEEAIQNTINELEGTWALVIIYTEDLDTYYVTRKGSPLLLGYSDNYIMCSSEVNGFGGLVQDYIILNDSSIIKITENNFYTINNGLSESCFSLYDNCDISNFHDLYNIKKVPENMISPTLYQYEHWMIKEIMEQPESIQAAYNYGGRIHNNNIVLGGLVQLKNIITNIDSIEHVILLGCGTSYNAALIGEQYFKENSNFVTVSAINACEFKIIDLPNCNECNKTICLFLSQSGETSDLYNCLKLCNQVGVITVGIINVVDSLIAREVNCGVYLNAGCEISVASTKSFTSMIIVLSLINLWFNENKKTNAFNNIKQINNMRMLSSTLNNLIYNYDFLSSLDNFANIIQDNNINNIFILGKNKLYPVACEGSLKIKEVTYIHCEGFSGGSLKHGPFALLDDSNLTVLLIDYMDNDNNNYDKIKSTYYELKSRTKNVLVITNFYQVKIDLELNDENCLILYKLEYYNEIIFTIALQYLAYNISILKNINPDKPRNLAKVVTVE